MSASIAGSWFGSVTDALPDAALVVKVDDRSLGPPEQLEIAHLPIAKPFFDAELNVDELCSDASSPDAIDVRCVSGSRISRLVVRHAGSGLDASVDGAPAKHWTLPTSNACWDLHGYAGKRDLEPARAAWGRDVPSARCGSRPRARAVRVAIDFAPTDDGGSSNEIVASLGTWRKDLGRMANFGGGLHPHRYTDADAIELETNDMGVEYRELYRLGDRLYVVEDGNRISGTDLPCGAKVTFDVRYPHREGLIEETPRPMR